MNNSIYDEYMRNVLGYQPMDNNTYNYDMYYDNFEMANMSNMSAMSNMQREELEGCYPEIYRIVYPMVQKTCNQTTRPITRELIDSMTDEIYFSIEDREMTENRNNSKDEKSVKATESKEDRQITFRNSTLRDIIRILLLREFIGRPGVPGGRPPRPPMRPPMGPPRPPMGPPPRPQPRPGMGGFNRMQFGQYDDLYEL